MTDRALFYLTMTFPKGYNAPLIGKVEIVSRTCADEVLELGLVELTAQHSNIVKAYDLERTLCDLVRNQNT